jgi:hypothetical protein
MISRLIFGVLFSSCASFAVDCQPDAGSNGRSLEVISFSDKAHIIVKKENSNEYAFFNMIGNDSNASDREFKDDVFKMKIKLFSINTTQAVN